MKILKILVAALAVVLLAGGVVLYLAHRYLQSPDFKETVLAAARAALGSRVELNDLDISLLQGVNLRGIRIANPTGFEGHLLEAETFSLRYRLLPLLRKRVDIARLSLEQPTLRLVRNKAGTWNYEMLTSDKPDAATSPSMSSPHPTRVGGLEVSLERLAMIDGLVEMRDADGDRLLSLDGVNLSTTTRLADGHLSGTGQAGIGALNVAEKLYLRDLAAPVAISRELVRLDPLTGRCAGGRITGLIAYQLQGGSRYTVDLQVSNAEVATLLREAGAPAGMTGKLHATTTLAGMAGIETINGQGRAEVVDGQLSGIPFLALVGGLLQIPDLREIRFSECLLEFTIGDNQLRTTVIRLIAPRLELTGHGTLSLDDLVLDHDLVLAVDRELLARLPAEVRASFTERADGSVAIPFRVTGPYDNPQTDLTRRIVRGTADQLIRKGLEKLFE